MTGKLDLPPPDADPNPEWTEERFDRAKPFREVFPAFFEQWQAERNKGGRPRIDRPKVHLGLRLDAEVVAGVKATGKGYNARVEKVLREALARGDL